MSEGKLVIKSRRADAVISKLDEGDQLSYRVSHQVEFEDRSQAWVGMEYSSSVRAGEDAAAAADRLVGFVHDQLHARILQLVAENEHFNTK